MHFNQFYGKHCKEMMNMMKNEHWEFQRVILREPWMSINCLLCISEMHSLSWNRCQILSFYNGFGYTLVKSVIQLLIFVM